MNLNEEQLDELFYPVIKNVKLDNNHYEIHGQ